jgi:hypothetical protein
MALNDLMEFDHVVRVHPDGTVTDAEGIYAPSLWEGELDDDAWTLMNGYSGQDRYSGPVMHNSEFIGGQMAEDILATPGLYVAVVCYWDDDDDDDDDDAETIVEGWAVAYIEGCPIHEPDDPACGETDLCPPPAER